MVQKKESKKNKERKREKERKRKKKWGKKVGHTAVGGSELERQR